MTGPLDEKQDEVVDARVVLLTNFVPPYRLPVYEALADRVSSLTVLVSTLVERNRSWRPDAGRLDVRVQRSLSLRRSWHHPGGFSDSIQVHIPWDTLAQLRALRPDVVVSSELGFRSLFSALYCMRSEGTPLILWATLSERTEHGRGLFRNVLRRWLVRRADRVIVNGQSGERYVSRFGVPSQRIDRIPYTALPLFSEAGSERRQNRGVRHLLFAGQLTERKGLVPFLDQLNAWAKSHHDEEITLTVAGSSAPDRTIEDFRPSGRLAIRLVGDQNPADLAALLAQTDALVLPTLADEWGLVVNEALAAGVPVIGSVHSEAVVELCDDGETGWLFTPEDEASTRGAIERALATRADELSAMRERAKERVCTLTPAWAADRIVETIQASLADSAQRS